MANTPKLHLRKNKDITYCGRSVLSVTFTSSPDGIITCRYCSDKHNRDKKKYGELRYYLKNDLPEKVGYKRKCLVETCEREFVTASKFTRNCGCNSGRKELMFEWNG